MSPWESKLVHKAIDAITRVIERHEGGARNAPAQREIDHHVSTVRIYTTDTVCREKFSYIQDQAALYFSGARHADAGSEIRRTLSSLRSRLHELERKLHGLTSRD